MWLKLLWSLFVHPRRTVILYQQFFHFIKLHQSPLMFYVKRAVQKVSIDPSFHPTKDHYIKRKEALEWTAHYLRDAGMLDPRIPWPTWEASFLVEWAVGELKGKI